MSQTRPVTPALTARRIALLVTVVHIAFGVVAVGLALIASHRHAPNTDPRHGSVAVSKDRIAQVTKHCEGSTLVWLTDSYRAAPRITSRLEPASPQCR